MSFDLDVSVNDVEELSSTVQGIVSSWRRGWVADTEKIRLAKVQSERLLYSARQSAIASVLNTNIIELDKTDRLIKSLPPDSGALESARRQFTWLTEELESGVREFRDRLRSI